MNGCVYCTKDNECDLWTDDKHKSFCDPDCNDKHPSNADKFRNMTDEEMAEWMVAEQINGIYAFFEGLEDDDLLHDFIEVINSHGAEEIKKEKLGWLKQECE